jgi:SAM-dependent methyltransferase
MKAVLRSLKRNAVALRKSPRETRQAYQSRLLFELRRRSNQLLAKLNPFDQDQYYFERLVGPLGIWPHLQQYQFNALTSLGLKPHHSVIDIGCGPITVGLALISYLDRGNYVGLDLLPEPLDASYRRVAKHGLAHKNPTLVCSTTFGKRELASRTFDFVWMSQLSYHLDDVQMKLLFEQACSMMSESSVFLADVIDPGLELDADMRWRGFAYHIRPIEFYESIAQQFSLSVQRRGTLLDYGYPDKINLSANTLLEFRKLGSPPLQPQLDDVASDCDSTRRRDALLVAG